MAQAVTRFEAPTCPTHKTSKIAMVCANCDHQLVCNICMSSVHQGHHFIRLEDYVKIRKANLEHMAKKVETKGLDTSERLDTIKKYRSRNKIIRDRMVDDVTSKGKRMKDMVDKWVKKNVQNCEYIYNQNSSNIDSVEELLKNLLQSLKSSLEQGRSLVVSTTYQDLDFVEQILKKEMETSHNKEPCLKQLELVKWKITDQDVLALLGDLHLTKFDMFLDNDCYRQLRGWTIDRKDITISKEFEVCPNNTLNKGTFRGSPCVIRILRGVTKKETVDSLIQEANILTKVQHSNVIQLYGVCLSDPYCLVTENTTKGNLSGYLRQHEKSLYLLDLINFAAQIAEGMAYVSSNGIVHRDLRAVNILVVNDDEVKIQHFFQAVSLEEESNTWSPNESQENIILYLNWTAPETIQHLRFSTKSDVWSFGMLLWEILSFGIQPFQDLPDTEIKDKLKKDVCMSRPQTCNQLVYNIMVQCLKYLPEERPTFDFIQSVLNNIKRNSGRSASLRSRRLWKFKRPLFSVFKAEK